MTSLVLALRYLTIVPVPGRAAHGMEAPGRAAAWFPAVGLAIGAALVGVERLTSVLFPSLLSALLTVTVWKVLTGGLHLDGLADCLDGLVGRDAPHRLSIMRDSRIGAFGAVGLILFLLLEIAAVAELRPGLRWRALLVLPAIARAAPPLLASLFPPATAEGHGATFQLGVRWSAAPLALGLALAFAWAALDLPGLLVAVAAILAAVVFAWFMALRLAGITGDVYGAAIEVAELAGLLTVSAWAHVRL